MNGSGALFAVLVSLVVVACGSGHRAGKSTRGIPSDIPPEEAAFYAYTEGLKAIDISSDGKLAFGWFQKAVSIDPDHAPSYYEMAGLLADSNPDVALNLSRRAYSLDTTNVWYMSQLGRMYLGKGDYPEALGIFEELTLKDPYQAENYRVLAMLQQHQGQPFAAIMTLDSAENKIGRLEPLVIYRQQLLISTKQYQRAIKEAEALTEEFPYSADSFLSLGEVYANTGSDSLALVNYQRALAIDSTNLGAILALNEFYKERNDAYGFLSTTRKLFLSKDVDIDDKLEFLNEIKSNRDFYRANFEQVSGLATTLAIMYPGNFKAVKTYAESLIGYGNIDEAGKLYKNFIHNNPDSPLEAYEEIIGIEAYRNQSDSVGKYTALALARFPENPDLYIRKGAILAYMDDPEGALKAYESATAYAVSDSTKGVVLGIIGDLYHSRDEKKKAFDYYGRSLKVYPDNPIALNNYAYYLAEENDQLALALSMSEKAIKLSENNPTYLDTHAWVLYRLGRFAEARKAMQQAISLDRSDSSELAFHYGEILWELGEKYLATVYWKKALERGYDKEVIEQRLQMAGEK